MISNQYVLYRSCTFNLWRTKIYPRFNLDDNNDNDGNNDDDDDDNNDENGDNNNDDDDNKDEDGDGLHTLVVDGLLGPLSGIPYLPAVIIIVLMLSMLIIHLA